MTAPPQPDRTLIIRGDRMNEKYIVATLGTLAGLALYASYMLGDGPLAWVALPFLLPAIGLGLLMRRNVVTLTVTGDRLTVTKTGPFGFRPNTGTVPLGMVIGIRKIQQRHSLWRVALAVMDRNTGLCLDLSNGQLLVLARFVSTRTPAYRRAAAALEAFFSLRSGSSAT
ncbi:hypothetical protein HKCCE4037_08885 [Rhodobacterales bacterium HKCCE4037]|nr:hypothetical protein [Rhodobacterales bacterium HKCCE4037]